MNIIISNSSDKPIYEQIAEQIKNLIINGELTEGELMPSIRSLAKELQISVITTKRAYEELERDGYIVSVQGKGSYVSAQNKELLKEARLRIIEEKLSEAVSAAQTINMSLAELVEILEILYEEANIEEAIIIEVF
ncbi:MAG: GntR family transcriptional regulator [Clostridiaceae bacterium]|nr:GntR family transcriptional regulator [Clostridiaceae bacterium]